MGSNFTKDKNIDLYISLNQDYYVPGGTVGGQVYLNAKLPTQYIAVEIVINGQQYVHWTEGSGNNYHAYRNIHNSYQSSFILRNFNKRIPVGQYCFPFKFLLPQKITGSFTYSSECYIQYTCTARLLHPQPNRHQLSSIILNIIEPPNNIGPVEDEQTVQSHCCGCWVSYGKATSALTCDKGFLKNGEKFIVKGYIDNTEGKQQIKNPIVVLEEKRMMVGYSGHYKDFINHQYPLYQVSEYVLVGHKKQFAFEATVPDNIKNYTAIGRVTGRVFVLHLYSKSGCCVNQADVELHIIVHSQTPAIMAKQQIPPINDWDIRQFPMVFHNQMKPYIYYPLEQLPHLNIGKQKQVKQESNNEYLKYKSIKTLYEQPNWRTGRGELKKGQQPLFITSEVTEMDILSK